jgi:hypothetical protein
MARLPTLRVALAATIGAVALLPAAGPAPAAEQGPASSFAIRATGGLGGSVTRIGAFSPRRDPTIGAARRVFGRPSALTLRGGSCVVTWRRLGLRIVFANFGGTLPGQTTCTSSVGRAQAFTTRGPRFRTSRGLQVGDPSSRILDRHPDAEFREAVWWLVDAESPFGDGGAYPSLRAVVSGGRVVALGGWIGAAGE